MTAPTEQRIDVEGLRALVGVPIVLFCVGFGRFGGGFKGAFRASAVRGIEVIDSNPVIEQLLRRTASSSTIATVERARDGIEVPDRLLAIISSCSKASPSS